MKIKRKDLNRLIERFLNEEGTDPKGETVDDVLSDELEQTEVGDTFMANQMMRHGGKQPMSPEKRAQAITDFRKGSDRGQFPPLTFGPGVDDEGNLEDGEFTTVHDYHEPDPYDHAAVRRYKKDHYIGPNEKSVDDPEITRVGLEDINFDDDEDTEESFMGDYDEETDYSDEDFSQGPEVITYEDEEGNETTYLNGKDVSPKDDFNFIDAIRRFIGK
jgi:hypothetical protein